MKRKKRFFTIASIIAIIALGGIGYIVNLFFGNPISKYKAEKEVLAYFEKKYHKDFTVYSSTYNFLIPDYNIKIGPSDDKEAVFETSKYELTMYDSYGAYLAQEELKSKIQEVLSNEFPDFKFIIQMEEQHHTEIVGVQFDFYNPNPQTRLEKNYFYGSITWNDTGLSSDETIKRMDDMAQKINTELKGIPKELDLDVTVKDKSGKNELVYRFYVNGKAILKK